MSAPFTSPRPAAAMAGAALLGAGAVALIVAVVVPSLAVGVVASLAVAVGLALVTRSGSPTGPDGGDATPESLDGRTAAHEIRAPLAAALGHLDLAQSADRNWREKSSDVAQAVRALERADALVGILLTPASGSPGRLEEPLDLRLLLLEALEDFAPMAQRRRLAISVQHDAGPRGASVLQPSAGVTEVLPVLGDPRRLRQLIDNVLSNAVKYAAPESWIDITLSRTSSPDRVGVTVTNAGVTLTPEEVATAFEANRRGAAAADVAEGEGLGLSVAREVARSHGGDVLMTVDTEAITTTVHMWIPLNC